VSDEDSATKQHILSALVASGFPFQTAIAELARDLPDCAIAKEEFPWRDDTGVDRFLDLVVFRHNVIVTIECKKTQKEIFTFLQAIEASRENVTRSRCLYLTETQDAGMPVDLCFGDWNMEPRSAESKFCVVSTSDSGKDQRLLEKDAQLLIHGTDAVARHIGLQPRRPLGEPDRVFVPVIVTNAKLFNAQYDLQDVSLDTGQLPINPAPAIFPVEWVRFRKSFTAANAPDRGDRTIFVVAARSLQKFLLNLDYIDRHSPRDSVLFGRIHR
jgi:hypothetical protein